MVNINIDKILELNQSGKSLTRIAHDLGISRQTLFKYLKKHNIQIPYYRNKFNIAKNSDIANYLISKMDEMMQSILTEFSDNIYDKHYDFYILNNQLVLKPIDPGKFVDFKKIEDFSINNNLPVLFIYPFDVINVNNIKNIIQKCITQKSIINALSTRIERCDFPEALEFRKTHGFINGIKQKKLNYAIKDFNNNIIAVFSIVEERYKRANINKDLFEVVDLVINQNYKVEYLFTSINKFVNKYFGKTVYRYDKRIFDPFYIKELNALAEDMKDIKLYIFVNKNENGELVFKKDSFDWRIKKKLREEVEKYNGIKIKIPGYKKVILKIS